MKDKYDISMEYKERRAKNFPEIFEARDIVKDVLDMVKTYGRRQTRYFNKRLRKNFKQYSGADLLHIDSHIESYACALEDILDKYSALKTYEARK